MTTGAGSGDAPPAFEKLLAEILKNEGAKAQADFAHRFAALYLTLLVDGVEVSAAVGLTGHWMRELMHHGRETERRDAEAAPKG